MFSHPKGYVEASVLVKDQFIDQILSEAGVKDPSRQEALLLRGVAEYSTLLRANYSSIRRQVPYIAKYKQCYPVYVDSFELEMNE